MKKYKLSQIHRVLWEKEVEANSVGEALEQADDAGWKEIEHIHSQNIKVRIVKNKQILFAYEEEKLAKKKMKQYGADNMFTVCLAEIGDLK